MAGDDLLIVSTTQPDAIHAIDVSSPETPTTIATFPLYAHRLALAGSYLYAASGGEGLYILHLDPAVLP